MGSMRLSMTSPQRLVGPIGILFVIFYVVPQFLWGGIQPDQSASQVASELVSHRSAATTSAYLLLVASVLLLIFAAGVTRTGDAEAGSQLLSTAAFGAGAISAALLAAANATLAALAGYLVAGATPDSVRSLNGLWDALTTTSGLFLGLLVLVASLIAFKTPRLPVWMRWFGVAAGSVLMVGAGSVATPFHGVGPLWVLGLLATMVWITVTSLWMTLRPSA